MASTPALIPAAELVKRNGMTIPNESANKTNRPYSGSSANASSYAGMRGGSASGSGMPTPYPCT